MTALDLSPPEHQHSAIVEQAAIFWADRPAGASTRPVVELQAQFGLTAQQACEAIALADRMRMLRRAFG